jgi:hypothetical protein
MLVRDALRGRLRQVQAAAIKAGAVKAAALPVSGAFHTPLMEPARAALVQVGSPGRRASDAALPNTLSSPRRARPLGAGATAMRGRHASGPARSSARTAGRAPRYRARAPVAVAARAQALARVSFREPRIPVYSNVTAAPFPSAAAIPGLLARQARPAPPADQVQSCVTPTCALLLRLVPAYAGAALDGSLSVLHLRPAGQLRLHPWPTRMRATAL